MIGFKHGFSLAIAGPQFSDQRATAGLQTPERLRQMGISIIHEADRL